MKILYFDCGMGAAGDMLSAALLELLPEPAKFIDDINKIGLPGVSIKAESSVKCGITGTHVHVITDGTEEISLDDTHIHDDNDTSCGHNFEAHRAHHAHHSMHDIEDIIKSLNVSDKIKDDVTGVYKIIADAESKVHGVPVTEVHFHEVGMMDAIADITCVCMLIDRIAPDKIISSPVCTGSGHVRCAHGILPVPAPATALILKDMPIYSGEMKGELCTPTGAALLKFFADEFSNMPLMKVEDIGYGMGQKDFEEANCVRAFTGSSFEQPDDIARGSADKDSMITELSCNVDDMTAEEIGFASERFFELGAADVFTVPAGMKKSRPGTLVKVLCRTADREKMVEAIFRYTSTIGIRENECRRYTLGRKIVETDTPVGKVHQKISTGYGVVRKKYEYDDLARIAEERSTSVSEIKKIISQDQG